MTLRESLTGNNHDRNYKRPIWFLLVLLVLSGASSPLSAQSKSQLEKDKAKVEQEIKKLNGDLAKAKKNSKNNQQQIQLLDKKISQRTKLINTISGELNLLNIQMTQTQDSITLMQTQVDSLKREYAKVVRVLYGERGNLDRMSLLFDTKSYNTAFLRTKYFRDYSRYRRRQAAVIRQKEDELHDAGVQLAAQKQQTTSLLVQEKRQKDELAREQRERQQNLKKSKQQEKDLQAQISKKEKQKRQLQQQIQKIINEEIAKSRRSSQPSGSGGTTTNTADVALSNDFAGNKGRLPWPVYYTKVAREYGRYTHSSGGQNMNNGIDLQCKSRTSVQAVFSGTVSRVFTTPGGTKGIIVRHG